MLNASLIVDNERKVSYPIVKQVRPVFHKGSRIGCLLLHGFTSSPRDFRHLTKYLISKNYTVYAPLLKGHGTSPEDMIKFNWKDWYNESKQGLNEIRKHCDRVIVIGSSLGANLAVLLAKEEKIDGIVLLGTPLWFNFNSIVKLMVPFLSIFKKFIKKRFQKAIKKVDKEKIHYAVIPVSKLKDQMHLMKLTKNNLEYVDVPALILHSENDLFTPKSNAIYTYKHINSRVKRLKLIHDSYHVFIVDKNRGIAFKEIYKFIKEEIK